MTPDELHRAGVPNVAAIQARVNETQSKARLAGAEVFDHTVWTVASMCYRDALAIITAKDQDRTDQ